MTSSQSSSAKPPPTKPVPLEAFFQAFDGTWWVQFDQALQAGPVDTGNWSLRADGRIRNLTGCLAAGTVVTSGSTPGALAGGNRCSYDPPPFDVRGLVGGLPADPFFSFPVTTI